MHEVAPLAHQLQAANTATDGAGGIDPRVLQAMYLRGMRCSLDPGSKRGLGLWTDIGGILEGWDEATLRLSRVLRSCTDQTAALPTITSTCHQAPRLLRSPSPSCPS